MSSFDWCSKCHFRRWIEGYVSEQDYLDNGWVKTLYQVLDKNGVRESIANWKCPVCDEEDKRQRRNF